MRVLLTGASGQLGAYLLERLRAAGYDLIAWSGSDSGTRNGLPLVPIDLADAPATSRALDEADPDWIVHAAAVSTAEGVRLDPERARAVNVGATGLLADWCARRDRRILYTSTDLVFDGSRPWWREEDAARPILAYGRSKLAGERPILAVPRGLVARVALLYGPSRSARESPFDRTIAALRRGEPQTFFEDEYRTPLDLATAATILWRLAESEATGLIHVAGPERVSRFDLIHRVAIALGLDPHAVRPNRQADRPGPEPRPADVSLETERLAGLPFGLGRPTIEEAVQNFIFEI
jgi:dTDP-4-dehydrorhamnose reductase